MISGFQFRAAKAAIGIESKKIAEFIGLTQATLVRFGHTDNLMPLKAHQKSINLLGDFFYSKGIIFTKYDTISLINEKNIFFVNPERNLTRFQLVCARISTRLTQNELSYYIKLSSSSLSILENLSNTEYIYSTKVKVRLLKDFFEHLGIVFMDGLTVSLKKDPQEIIF